MSDKRIETLAQTPTFKELGHNLLFSVWRGIGVPKGTPAEAVEKWRVASRALAQSAEFQATMRKQNLTPAYADLPEFASDVGRQGQAFKALVPKLNLKQ
jgi:tripartite-type tricarboxylate transporter receptor subunit TctC